jgi:osmotically-inducible protein OsmY
MQKTLILLISAILTLSGCNRNPNGSVHNSFSSYIENLNVDRFENTQSNTTSNPTLTPFIESQADRTLNHEILSALISQDSLKSAHISVYSSSGNVLVLGEVPDQESAVIARNIIASIDNVQSIQTALTIGPTISRAQRTTDSITTTEVKTAIRKIDIPHKNLQVITHNNRVYIIGLVSYDDQRLITEHLTASGIYNLVLFYYYE